jgi:hypothetical protein
VVARCGTAGSEGAFRRKCRTRGPPLHLKKLPIIPSEAGLIKAPVKKLLQDKTSFLECICPREEDSYTRDKPKPSPRLSPSICTRRPCTSTEEHRPPRGWWRGACNRAEPGPHRCHFHLFSSTSVVSDPGHDKKCHYTLTAAQGIDYTFMN